MSSPSASSPPPSSASAASPSDEPAGRTDGASPPSPAPLHLAVALDGAGWHPAAWREPEAMPRELLTAAYWAGLVAEAERGLLDFVTIEDALGLQSSRPGEPDERTDQVRGRLDAVLTAARVAPLTQHIGLVPTVVATHTEPFHISKAIATLDYASTGRAGVRLQVSGRRNEAAHFGRRTFPPPPGENGESAENRENGGSRGAAGAAEQALSLLDEAADYGEVVRRLWDSWEDDAEIRDAATGRFIDRHKLHYIDFEGRHFSVKGPSVTPRPPQGQPVVTALAHGGPAYRLLARTADVGFLTPGDAEGAHAAVEEIRGEQAAAGRAHEPLHLFADLLVYLDRSPQEARARRERLDRAAGEPYTGDAQVFTGTPAGLADLLQEWARAGLSGFRLRPAVAGHDLPAITRGLVPELQSRGAFRHAYEARTLRGLLRLARPANRYATASTTA